MALNKVTYVDGETVITAENLNDIQDAIIALENAPTGGTVSDDLKQALLQLAQKVAYIDDQGQSYYDDLYDALYPPRSLNSIDAVFNQGSAVIYDTASLNSLKQYLTVTANYSDGTREMLSDSAYTLSGTLTVGTSTVTASYQGKTDTFAVTVTEAPVLDSISAVYTQSGTVYDTDTLDSLKDDLVVTAHYADSSTQTVPAADYVLSGALTVGTSTITVSYGGKTTTFSVTVSEAPLLPSTFQQVEYIKATGTQHIFTNIQCNDGAKSSGDNNIKEYSADIDFQWDEWQSSYATNIVFSCGSSGGNWIGYANGVTNIAMGTSSGQYFTDSEKSNRHQFHWSWSGTTATFTRNDGVSVSRSNTATSSVERRFTLFYADSNSSSDYHFNGKVFSCKVYKNDVKVLDLIPCYRKADNVIGMYDTVNEVFYTNNGSGTFEKGADVA